MKRSRPAGTLNTVAAFARTPAGRQVIGLLTALAVDPDARSQARQSLARWRARRARGEIVDADGAPAQLDASRSAC